MRGRGSCSCHSTCHRYVRLPHDQPQPNAPATRPATAKCTSHTTSHSQTRQPHDQPQPNAPATRPATAKRASHMTSHHYSSQVVRRIGTVRSMDLKGGISWKIGKYKTALREKKTIFLFFYILSTCFLSLFFLNLAMTALG